MGTLETDEGRPALRFERYLHHPVERVWRAITDPEEMRHWFPGSTCEVTRSEPPRLLVGSWYGDTLRFELSPDGEEGCVLVFTHAFAEREKAARDAAGWESCFVRLDALLAGKPMGEADSLKSWPETHERYAERFDIDPEIGRAAFAQHQQSQ
jgi:uncharacterized protein YndB with AHSA1/START domain